LRDLPFGHDNSMTSGVEQKLFMHHSSRTGALRHRRSRYGRVDSR
jgi:hypothetical protein